ncbi:MAG: M1 family aminopeptidase [Terriglobales bacterium]
MAFRIFVAAILLASSSLCAAENPPAGPNSDPTYQQLRNLTLGGEAVSVSNLDLKRDAGTFHLHSGTVCFVTPVQGKVTGAVFTGDGNFVLDPPLESERQSLKLLTKENEFSEKFTQAVLRFTDSTYDEIKNGGSPASGGCDANLLKDSQNTTRHKLNDNLEARILEDVMGPEPGGLFVAFIHGKRYNNKELYTIDPHSASDQVELMTYDENKHGVWAGLDLSQHTQRAVSRNLIHIDHQQLDTTIEKNAHLTGKATTTFVSLVAGLRVVPFNLFPTLRVESVTANTSQALAFIQENKNDDPDFAVILPQPLAQGEKYTITTTYTGKDAVSNEGNGNYFPIARDNWYPNNRNSSLGEYSSYDMIFRTPKGMKIVATGTLVNSSNEGDRDVSVWKSEVPQTVAGFNLGRFKVEEAKLTKPDYVVQSFANEELPDAARGLYNTTIMMKKVLAEGELAVQVYSDYFGPSPYKRLAMTQQTACSFGQSWPELVWLPICSFFDSTVRHGLGLDFRDRGYWKVVAPHEVAHQWWGHAVGFSSYRDQWMSEGFADFSASLFLQVAYGKDPKAFLAFWKDERELLTDKNKEGFRAIDVGPLTMGYRLNNSKAGFNIARDLIYPKGAYILHMIRMMMWDRKTGDENFKAAMQDFVKTYSGKAATTEDFKAMMEKHMTQEMDLDGNHRLDWFFNEYINGTALPTNKIDSRFEKDANGDVVFGFKVTQSGVDDKFRMIVPIYLELADGRTVNLGRAHLTGNSSVDQKVPLRGLKDTPKRALLNYNDDVLASN